MAKYTPAHASLVPKNNSKKKRNLEKGFMAGTVLSAALIPVPLAPQNIAYANTASDREAFIEEVGSVAQQVADANGLYASVMIAQAIHESNWGQSQLSSAPYYNFFGIKGSYNGKSVSFPTQEYLNGKWVTVKANFRAYPSYRESLQDNANLLRTTNFGNGNFYAGAWKENTNSYLDATSFLTGRYATDPNYANALNNLIAAYDLTRFDTPGSGSVSPVGKVPEGTTGTYKVKAGDSLWAIAQKYQTSVQKIKTANGLTSDNIYINQILKIPGKQENTDTPKQTGNANSSGASTTYKVKAGDSLWAIAQKYQTSVANLKALNKLTSDSIYINQTLKVSGKQGSTTNTDRPKQTGNTNSSGASTTYKVKAGDSLWAIAQKYQTSVANLKALNKLTSDSIYINQTLKVSGKQGSTTNTDTPKQTGNTNSSGTNTTYKVKAGDSLWAIAQKYQTSVANLKALNKLTSDSIYINQTLKVSGKQGSTTNTDTPKQTGNTNSSGTNTTYKVKAGDSLWAIAQKYQTSVANLKALNKLTSDSIYINQTLKVSGKQGSTMKTETPKQTGNTNSSGTSTTYKVKAGDSLWAIAQKYQTSVGALKTANELSNDHIYINQTLKIPKTNSEVNPVSKKSQKQEIPKVDLKIPRIGIEHVTTSNEEANQRFPRIDLKISNFSQKEKAQTLETTALESAITPISSALVPNLETIIDKNEEIASSANLMPDFESLVDKNEEIASSTDLIFDSENSVNKSEESANSTNLMPDFESPVGKSEEIPNSSSQTPELEAFINENEEINNPISQIPELDAPVEKSEEIPSSASQTPDFETVIYKVKSEDTLSKIADTHQTTVETIKILNMLTFDTLYEGQTLRLPKTEEVTVSENPIPTSTPVNYQVKSGDTLPEIAKTYQTTVAELQRINNLSSSLIYVGQNLKIQ